MRADDIAVVGMSFRVEALNHRLFRKSVRLVLDALTPLVSHDILLVGKCCLVDLVEQVAHAIRLEPQRQFQLIGGYGLEIVGAIVVGRAVDIARARGLEQLEMRVGRHVLRALKHHVLEEMRKPGATGLLVGWTNVIPEVDGDHRHPRVAAQDHVEPVRQGVLLKRNARDVSRRRLGIVLVCNAACHARYRNKENDEEAQIGFNQHDVCLRPPFSRDRSWLS